LGVSLIGLTRDGTHPEESARELLFGALGSVVNTPSARWLTGLIDLICDGSQLAEFENGDGSVSVLASHEVAAMSKWAIARLARLAKKGLIPLESFATTLAPVVTALPKTTAKAALKAMSTRLKKDTTAAQQVAAAAKAACPGTDAAVAQLATALLEQCEQAGD
jgi:hypothetical protein